MKKYILASILSICFLMLCGSTYYARHDVINVADYGAKGDFRTYIDASADASSTTLTVPSATFTSADVGKKVYIHGSGAAGAMQETSIAAYVSAHVVTISDATTTLVSGVYVDVGTDNTTTIQNAATAAYNSGMPLVFPKDSTNYYPYLISGQIILGGIVYGNNVTIQAEPTLAASTRMVYVRANSKIYDLVVDGYSKGSRDSGFGNGTSATNVFGINDYGEGANVLLENVTTQNMNETGILIDAASATNFYWTLRNCKLTNCGHNALSLSYASHVTIEGGYVHGSGSHAAQLSNCSYIDIGGNFHVDKDNYNPTMIYDGGTEDGFLLAFLGTCSHVLVHDSIFENNQDCSYDGISMAGSSVLSSILIDNVIVRNAGGIGIGCTTGMTVSNSYIYNARLGDIAIATISGVTECKNIHIVNNVLDSCVGGSGANTGLNSGIFINNELATTGTFSNISIVGNRFIDTKGSPTLKHGVQFWSSGGGALSISDFIIKDNDFSSSSVAAGYIPISYGTVGPTDNSVQLEGNIWPKDYDWYVPEYAMEGEIFHQETTGRAVDYACYDITAVANDSFAITSSDQTLTCTTGRFASSDVGKAIRVEGAGADGGNLYTTIASINSSTSIELGDSAGTSVTNAYVAYWTWKPLRLYGSTATYYVDKTNGVNSFNKGYGTTTNAYKSSTFALANIPYDLGASITTINYTAETYDPLIIKGRHGEGYVIIQGTKTTVVSASTADAYTNGSGSTRGNVQDTGAFGSVLEGDLVYNSGLAVYRVVYSVDSADQITIVGTWGGTPSGTYAVYRPGTKFDATHTSSYAAQFQHNSCYVIVRDSELSDGLAATIAQGYSPLVGYLRCHFTSTTSGGTYLSYMLGGGCDINYDQCYFSTSAGNKVGCYFQKNGGYYNFNGSLFGATSSTSISADNFARVHLYGGTSILHSGGAGNGIVASGHSKITFAGTSASGYEGIAGCLTGVTASGGAQVTGTTNNIYSGNSTDESATSGTYGYID